MSPIVAIVLSAAAKIGAPIVKGILEKHVGGTASEIGGTVIDAIAGQAGVPVEDLPKLPPAELEEAVRSVEQIAPELILADVERQKEANRLMLAEMEHAAKTGEPGWTWTWRPAGMWLMLSCIAWYVIIVPVLNLLLTALGAQAKVELTVDFVSFVGVFVTFTTLYMGGNTALRGIGAWKAGK
ncbi:hypothetical protein [Ciceribacter sp. L1K22]|uniref:hypothetical protein n=1 Tax=Ciceribacter sp. L1K22 TaxID=2820275 RepID=UPI001ABDD561|nr:hypothetical protein [Ciceribacter sp. L1K22]MBO3760339.1 hypothetical protein [Ciceribacter sp. L1K22]